MTHRFFRRAGKIKELGNADRHTVIASRYIKATKRKRSTLIVSPTHAEGRALTIAIRDQLRKKGAIGKETHDFSQLRSLNLTDAQKGESITYAEDGLVVQFHQNVVGGFKRGERYRVSQADNGSPSLVPIAGGTAKPLPHRHPDRFEVYREEKIQFSQGDKIRFSLGGTASDRKRKIANGLVKSYACSDIREMQKRDSGHIELSLYSMEKYRVTIVGRNLGELFDLLIMGRIKSMTELGPRTFDQPEESPAIDTITIEALTGPP